MHDKNCINNFIFSCGLDAVLLSTPDYDTSLRLATKAYHVFKYADRPVLQFQCQVTLCLKLDGGCNQITPPKCPETKPLHLPLLGNKNKKSRIRKSRDLRKSRPRSLNGLETVDVFTKPVLIVEEQFASIVDCSLFPNDNKMGTNEKAYNFYSHTSSLAGIPLIFIVAGLAALNLLTIGIVAIFVIQRRFAKKIHFKN